MRSSLDLSIWNIFNQYVFFFFLKTYFEPESANSPVFLKMDSNQYFEIQIIMPGYHTNLLSINGIFE